jgi:Protein of unknown function (DUF2001).
MSESTTEFNDTLSSHEGKAYMTISGKNREGFEISKLTAEVEFTIASKRMLGHRWTQHKPTGVEGTGSMTMYFMNSEMLQAAQAYTKSGAFTGFTLLVINDDPKSSVGTQEVALYGVIPKKFPVAYLDDSSDDELTFDTDFTYDSLEVLSSFSRPTNFA